MSLITISGPDPLASVTAFFNFAATPVGQEVIGDLIKLDELIFSKILDLFNLIHGHSSGVKPEPPPAQGFLSAAISEGIGGLSANQIYSLLILIHKGVHTLSKQISDLGVEFSAFSTEFATFAADANKALTDIAARGLVDPTDAATIAEVAAGLTSLSTNIADLDAKIKAADPGTTAPPPPGPTPPTV